MLKLFIIMWFMDGTVVTYLHKDNMTALQCSQAASFEVQRLREADTSDMSDIDVVCGTAKDLVGRIVE